MARNDNRNAPGMLYENKIECGMLGAFHKRHRYALTKRERLSGLTYNPNICKECGYRRY